ncbi:MAG: hypothetical protein L0I76_08635 [Pseudonocardia sp.]|nr:hypothetical protein [Pseudonocardia sp.]
MTTSTSGERASFTVEERAAIKDRATELTRDRRRASMVEKVAEVEDRIEALVRRAVG